MPDRTGLPTRYSVEVFIRTPFEGTSQYRATYTAPPFALEDAPAGVPSGPGSVSPAPPTGQAPFYGETTSRALFPPYPAAAIEAANADRKLPPAPLLEAPRAPASFWQGGLAPPTAPPPARRRPRRPRADGWAPRRSTYASDFTPQKLPPSEPAPAGRGAAPPQYAAPLERVPFVGRCPPPLPLPPVLTGHVSSLPPY
jgi:hypothetical protein